MQAAQMTESGSSKRVKLNLSNRGCRVDVITISPARTVGETQTMSLAIVSKFDREAFINQFEQLPPKLQDSYLSFLERLAAMTPDEYADFTAYIERFNYDVNWAALLSGMMYAQMTPDEREIRLQKAGLRPGYEAPAIESQVNQVEAAPAKTANNWDRVSYQEVCMMYRLSVKLLKPGEALHTHKHYSIFYDLASRFTLTGSLLRAVWEQYGGGQVVWHGYWFEVFPPESTKCAGNEG